MIPLRAALSNCASTELACSGLDFAFLNSVLRRVFRSRLRRVRRSVWRCHLIAALIFGTPSRIPKIRSRGKALGRRCCEFAVAGVPAGRDEAGGNRVADRAIGLLEVPAVLEPAPGRGLPHLDE